MKATFATSKRIDFKTMDNNEQILLSSFKAISDGKLEMVSEQGSPEIKYALKVKEGSVLEVNDNLNNKLINMKFPKLLTAVERQGIVSHDIITTRGGAVITCVVTETNAITVKLVMGVEEVLLYLITEAGEVKTNVEVLKMVKDIDLLVSAINKDSFFYNCFTI